MSTNGHGEHVETVVIGAGQAGLAVGYHLARHRREFLILDGADRVGESWRRRWDSLRLFTPARYDGLPGLRFPAGRSPRRTRWRSTSSPTPPGSTYP
jgi:putative flavoprotein involved in K+ transport